MTVPVLELLGIKRVYKTAAGELNVLSDADLKLQAGELVGLIGPSGSGKSTLLHTAGLLERPEAGAVLLDGIDCLKLDDKARTAMRRSKIGFVYQFHHLLPEFSALENVMMPCALGGMAVSGAKQKAERFLTQVGLAERLAHKPGELSGGERQRVAIARALVNEPQCVLMDEPTGNLDEHTGEGVRKLIESLRDELGISFVMVTHDMKMARSLGRVLRLEQGRLVQEA